MIRWAGVAFGLIVGLFERAFAIADAGIEEGRELAWRTPLTVVGAVLWLAGMLLLLLSGWGLLGPAGAP
jgi:hypothetical protein